MKPLGNDLARAESLRVNWLMVHAVKVRASLRFSVFGLSPIKYVSGTKLPRGNCFLKIRCGRLVGLLEESVSVSHVGLRHI